MNFLRDQWVIHLIYAASIVAGYYCFYIYGMASLSWCIGSGLLVLAIMELVLFYQWRLNRTQPLGE